VQRIEVLVVRPHEDGRAVLADCGRRLHSITRLPVCNDHFVLRPVQGVKRIDFVLARAHGDGRSVVADCGR
jgi:hypothetical protein